MRCSKCGTEGIPGKKFCAECGSPLSNRCSNCHSDNAPGAKFCADCGSALGTDVVAGGGKPSAAKAADGLPPSATTSEPSALPQSAQNFAPGALSELHFEQRFESGLPHSAQNFLPGIPSVPHFEQRICPPERQAYRAFLYHHALRSARCKLTRAINLISSRQVHEQIAR